MIAALRGNLTNLRINCAGPRPATKSLAATATCATAFSTNLCAGSVHRGHPIKPANPLDRIRKTRSTNLRHTPPATKSP